VGGKTKGLGDGSPLFLAQPSFFSETGSTGMRATLPLVDPVTSEFVAESLLEFSAEYIADSMGPRRTVLDKLGSGAFPLVLSYERNKRGANTIFAPDISFGQEELPVEEYLLGNDGCTDTFDFGEGCSRREAFQDVLEFTELRGFGGNRFERSDENNNLEEIQFGFAPVVVTTHKPVDPSDFTSGLQRSETTVFSLWLCQSQKGAETSVARARRTMGRITTVALVILGTISAITFLVVLYISASVSMSITIPVSQLHSWIKQANRYVPSVHKQEMMARIF